MGDALMAGAVAVVVLDDASRELDVEDRELGFVGAEAPELGVVGHCVEAAAAVGVGGLVVGQRAGRLSERAVRLTELAVERRSQHDAVLFDPESGELAGRDRRGEHVPRQAHGAPAGTGSDGATGSAGVTIGSGSSNGVAGGGTGMWISRFGSPIRPMPLLVWSAAHAGDHILRDVAHRVEGLLTRITVEADLHVIDAELPVLREQRGQ